MFLKYLDALDRDKATETELERRKSRHILDKPYRWETWAVPNGNDGKIDHNVVMVGDDFTKPVNEKLLPYRQSFKQKASGPNTIEYKIGEIRNKIQSGCVRSSTTLTNSALDRNRK